MARIDYDTDALASKAHKKLSVFVRKIALDGMRQLIRQTPVDTGRAKANWSSSAGRRGTGTTKGTNENFSKQSKGIPRDSLNKNLYLYNNLAYIMPLEMGSSTQAPAGWIRNTGKMMQKKLDEVRQIL